MSSMLRVSCQRGSLIGLFELHSDTKKTTNTVDRVVVDNFLLLPIAGCVIVINQKESYYYFETFGRRRRNREKTRAHKITPTINKKSFNLYLKLPSNNIDTMIISLFRSTCDFDDVRSKDCVNYIAINLYIYGKRHMTLHCYFELIKLDQRKCCY